MTDESPATTAPEWTEVSDPARLAAKPVVSVVMCAYRHAPYLAEAVQGVLMQQTDFPIELVIGEDCSPDDTREVALRLQREHPDVIRVICWKHNVGAHLNVRRIIDSARGEFVAHCDGDDYWSDPSKLQRQVDVFRARPDVSAVFTNFGMVGFQDGKWSVRLPRAVPSDLLASLRGNVRGKAPCGTLRTLTSAYRASVLAALHARELPMEQYPFSDGFMVAQAIASGNIECIDRVCAMYRQSPDSATRSSAASNLRVVRAVRDFYERHDEFFPEIAPLDAAVTRSANIAVCRAAYAAGDAEAYRDAYRHLQRAEAVIPRYLTVLRVALSLPGFRRMSLSVRSLLQTARRSNA